MAPIVFENCAPCHRRGGAAPFALVEFEDVRRRARQIVEVTQTGYMPPWLPEPDRGEFEGERRLTASERDVLKRWADADAPEGELAALPAVPEWTEGWELGEPDLVVDMKEPFDLVAEGADVFRNFVVPVPLDRPRFVEALEFRPSERRLVHHATVTVDSARASRRLDAEDVEPGFEGMRAAPGVVMPDGHFLGWTPGRSPYREPEGMSWRLEASSDLVLQLHMPTTGKPEKVSARVGLFFTDTPPRVVPVTLRLGSRHFEIPPESKDFRIEDAYVMPVDARAVSIYPHAHYLARDMRARAVLPDGTELWLIHIRDWNFNWQDFYRYRAPVFLPQGTTIEMAFTFDNSEDNPRNPSRPPKLVSYGPFSTDEMADLYLQVVPSSAEEVDVLRADYTAKELREALLELEFRIDRDRSNAELRNSLGVVLQRVGRVDEAIASIREALRIDPGNRNGHFNLGTLLAARGARAEATRHFRAVVDAEPECLECSVRLGNLLRDTGRWDEAIFELERAVALDGLDGWAHYSLGLALQLRGRTDEAISEYRRVVALEPENVEARLSLGSTLAGEGRCTAAVAELERAVRLAPVWSEPLSRLAWALTLCPNASPDAPARAVAFARRAGELSGYSDPGVLDTLASALAATGETREARDVWTRALGLAERGGHADLAGQIRQRIEALQR